MRTIHLIKTNLEKAFMSYYFIVSVILTFILFITCSLYYDYDANCDGSILNAFFNTERSQMLQNTQFCSYNVLQNSISGWMKMFVPMIVSFPFVSSQCTEHITGASRLSSIRISKHSYQTGTFLSAMLIGGFILAIGFAIFSICVAFMFPSISLYDLQLRNDYEWWIPQAHPLFKLFGYPFLIVLRFLEMFLYGAVSAVPACFMMCLLNNKYLIISMPFFLKYLLLQQISRLRIEAYSDYKHIDEKLVLFTEILNPDSFSQIFSGSKEIWKSIAFYTAIIVMLFISYSIVLNRKWDYGT